MEQTKNTQEFCKPPSVDAHWKAWITELRNAPVEPLPKDQIAFQALCVGHERRVNPVLPVLREQPSLALIEKIMGDLKTPCTPWLVVYLAGLSFSHGEIAVFLAALWFESLAQRKDVIDFSVFLKVFQHGVYSEETIADLWEKQKLDTPHNGTYNLIELTLR